jgi:hypothetical protein
MSFIHIVYSASKLLHLDTIACLSDHPFIHWPALNPTLGLNRSFCPPLLVSVNLLMDSFWYVSECRDMNIS